MVTNGTLYDSEVLMKYTGVIQSLPIDGNQWKAKKLNWPITRYLLKTDVSWIEYMHSINFG